MKKVLVLLMVVFSVLLLTAEDNVYITELATIGMKQTVITSAVVTYADTDPHGFTLDNGLYAFDILYYAGYALEYNITYTGNPNDVDLVISVISITQWLDVADAITQFDEPGDWAIETIDLNTSGGTSVKSGFIPEGLLNGRFIYFIYEYSGDPGNDPVFELFITKI